MASPERDRMLSNALLHTFLLAARSLLAFLYSHNPRESDIIAEDFFEHPDDWQKQRAVPSPEMATGALIGEISRWLAHLTWDRAGGTKPTWGAFQIAWNIGIALRSFVNLAEHAKIHEQLRIDLEVVMTSLESLLNQHPEFKGAMAPTLDWLTIDDFDYFAVEGER